MTNGQSLTISQCEERHPLSIGGFGDRLEYDILSHTLLSWHRHNPKANFSMRYNDETALYGGSTDPFQERGRLSVCSAPWSMPVSLPITFSAFSKTRPGRAEVRQALFTQAALRRALSTFVTLTGMCCDATDNALVAGTLQLDS